MAGLKSRRTASDSGDNPQMWPDWTLAYSPAVARARTEDNAPLQSGFRRWLEDRAAWRTSRTTLSGAAFCTAAHREHLRRARADRGDAPPPAHTT